MPLASFSLFSPSATAGVLALPSASRIRPFATARAPVGGGEDGLDPALGDATSALVNLGYGRAEAFGAVIEAARELGSDAKVEALIRTGLTRLGAAA